MKIKYEIFLQWNSNLFLRKILGLLHFGSCRIRISSENLVAPIH